MSEKEKENVSRRAAIQTIGGTVLGLAVGAAAGYLAKPTPPAQMITTTETVEKTVTVTGATSQVTSSALPTLDVTGQMAVEAAKKFAGTHITAVVEAGFDEQSLRVFAAEFNNLTGMNVEILPQPTFGIRTKMITEGLARSGAVDCVTLFPIWAPDCFTNNLLLPLDSYIAKYRPDLTDVTYLDYHNFATWYPGHSYAMPLDGDIFILYYRKDVFEDPGERAAFKQQTGRDLAVPATWKEFTEVAKFLTRKPGEKLMGETVQTQFGGQVEFRAKGGVFWWFFNRFCGYGGRYFKVTGNEIEPAINSPGAIEALKDMVECTPYGIAEAANVSWTDMNPAVASGNGAMTIFWPMLGPYLQYVKDSKVVNKMGYALMPGAEGWASGGNPDPGAPVQHRSIMAAGKVWTISTDSRNPEAAYLFTQWTTSPDVHARMVKWAMPESLGAINSIRRREFDDIAGWAKEFATDSGPSHKGGPWPGAAEYIKANADCFKVGMPDILVPGWSEFQDTIDTELSNAIQKKKSPEKALNDCYDTWVKLIDKYGKDEIMKWYKPEMYEPGFYAW